MIEIRLIGAVRSELKTPMLRAGSGGLTLEQRLEEACAEHHRQRALVSEIVLEPEHEIRLEGLGEHVHGSHPDVALPGQQNAAQVVEVFPVMDVGHKREFAAGQGLPQGHLRGRGLAGRVDGEYQSRISGRGLAFAEQVDGTSRRKRAEYGHKNDAPDQERLHESGLGVTFFKKVSPTPCPWQSIPWDRRKSITTGW